MTVEPGIYLLRYVGSRAPGGLAPVIIVTPVGSHAADLVLLSVPGGMADRLQGPGDCVLVRAARRGTIALVVRPSVPDGSVDAEVRLERVTATDSLTEPQVAPVRAATKAPRKAPISRVQADEAPIQMLAHVSHRGDVLAKSGEWICGPELPIAIEGFEVRWPNKPAGLTLSYAAKIGGRSRPRLDEKTSGQFAGTRGKASPLVGLRLALAGTGAAEYELQCDALFLGSQVMSRRGRTVVLSGATGLEPLVGLRLSVERQRADRVATKPLRPQKDVAERSSGRVRVYRSQTLSPSRLGGNAHA